ncbi:MAG: DNA repair protein RecN [Thermoleophilia bacterium]
MLLSLSVRDFVLIDDAVLDLAPGLTVLSGETGAGKTLLTQALGLLLGERAADGLVREPADEALIQGVFELNVDQVASLPADTTELLDLRPGELVASRRLSRTGRNRCFLNGVAVPLTVMGEVLGDLVSFSGQHEHRRLLRPAHQRAVVDAFAGAEQATDLAAYATEWAEARALHVRLSEGRAGVEEREREAALLRYQLNELEEAALDLEQERELEAEQRLLARAEEVVRACGEAAALLRGDDPAPDAGALVAKARARLAGVAGVDAPLDLLAGTLDEAAELLDDVSRGLHSYVAGLEVDPARLDMVDERLQMYTDLARKYGGSTEAALSHREDARARLAVLEDEVCDMESLSQRIEESVTRCLELAAALTRRRVGAGRALEEAITSHLADLGMPEGRVVVRVGSRTGWAGLEGTGADEVEFLLAANPGSSPRSLARTASGGELSRVLLGIKSALLGCEPAETVVFDEIDAGVGGLTATAVGAKLRALARGGQSVVVTHLPQVAAYADRHYLIRKESDRGTTLTRLHALDAEGALDELCRMLGGRPDDPGAREHARALRDRAAVGLID